jgi:DNA-binding transcriptional LysR family regulator
MDLNRVAVFVSVVATESFTAAAAKLGVPKSSVSRGVSQLEEELGVRLLERTTRKLSLTEAGEAFYRRAQPALAGLEEASAVANSLRREPRGTVRMTAPLELGVAVLPKLVVEFTKKYPTIQIALSLTSRVVDLVGEQFDLALRAGKLEDSSLVARKISNVDLALYASPAYLDRRGRPKSVAELAKHDCILHRSRGGGDTWTLGGPQGEEQVDVNGPVQADAMFFLMDAAIAGGGIALLPQDVADAEFRASRLERVLDKHGVRGGAYYLLMPSSRLVPAHVVLFRDFLLEHLSSFWAQVAVVCKERRPGAPPPSGVHPNGAKTNSTKKKTKTLSVRAENADRLQIQTVAPVSLESTPRPSR